jgi:hypothetical protein
MITLIEPHDAIEHRKLMEEMFRLRARAFRNGLGRDVQVADGMVLAQELRRRPWTPSDQRVMLRRLGRMNTLADRGGLLIPSPDYSAHVGGCGLRY